MQISYPLMMALLGGLKSQQQNRGGLVDIGGGYRMYSQPHWSQQLTNTLSGALEGGLGTLAQDKLAELAERRKLDSLKKEMDLRNDAALTRAVGEGGYSSREDMARSKREQRDLDARLRKVAAERANMSALGALRARQDAQSSALGEQYAKWQNRIGALDLTAPVSSAPTAAQRNALTASMLPARADAPTTDWRAQKHDRLVAGWVQKILDDAAATGKSVEELLQGKAETNAWTGAQEGRDGYAREIPPELYPDVMAALRERMGGAARRGRDADIDATVRSMLE